MVEIRRTVKGSPSLPYEKIATRILGRSYGLSLVICGDDLAQSINKKYRLPALKLRQAGKKTYSPNVLSFSYSKTEGEIFLNVRCAAREARAGGISPRARMALLFVHGCFHLKGYRHGRTMERQEARILRTFGLS